MNIKNKRG